MLTGKEGLNSGSKSNTIALTLVFQFIFCRNSHSSSHQGVQDYNMDLCSNLFTWEGVQDLQKLLVIKEVFMEDFNEELESCKKNNLDLYRNTSLY